MLKIVSVQHVHPQAMKKSCSMACQVSLAPETQNNRERRSVCENAQGRSTSTVPSLWVAANSNVPRNRMCFPGVTSKSLKLKLLSRRDTPRDAVDAITADGVLCGDVFVNECKDGGCLVYETGAGLTVE